MGLIKNAINAVGNTIKGVGTGAGGALLGGLGGVLNQSMYQEYFTSGSMDGDILMKRAEQVRTNGSTNKKSDANIISNGSMIDVQVNQCMIIVENGQVVEACMVPGRFTYNTDLAPSFFAGDGKFGANVVSAAKEIWEQAKVGGQRHNTQRVYFINMGILDEPFQWGLGNVPFRHCSKISDNTPAIRINMMLKGNGLAKVRIADALAFYNQKGAQKAGGDNDGIITLAELQETLFAPAKSMIRESIAAAVSQIGRQAEVAYTDILSFENADVFRNLVNERMKTSELALCGFEFSQFSVNGGFMPRDEDYKKLSDMEEELGTKVFISSNPNMAAYDVQKTLAGNEGGMSQMAGMGMVINGGFGQFAQPNQFAYQQNPQMVAGVAPAAPATPSAPAADMWTCSCGAQVTGKFCEHCGSKKPDANSADGWTCACGHVNKGKFCQECGSKKPAGAPLYRCDKCGWEPADPKNPPKFCPECGDRFDDGDIQ